LLASSARDVRFECLRVATVLLPAESVPVLLWSCVCSLVLGFRVHPVVVRASTLVLWRVAPRLPAAHPASRFPHSVAAAAAALLRSRSLV
jgi:hypothetical protein